MAHPLHPTESQVHYALALIERVGGEDPPTEEQLRAMSQKDVGELISTLKAKRGRAVWYGNGQFSHWEKDGGIMSPTPKTALDWKVARPYDESDLPYFVGEFRDAINRLAFDVDVESLSKICDKIIASSRDEEVIKAVREASKALHSMGLEYEEMKALSDHLAYLSKRLARK